MAEVTIVQVLLVAHVGSMPTSKHRYPPVRGRVVEHVNLLTDVAANVQTNSRSDVLAGLYETDFVTIHNYVEVL